ncbi:MAG: phosphate ABC transporter ATP-binding protein [Saprospiraceae bacterium]|jgi:phosphate transport system ATP-binding protein|nr:phosphate ABC transporter ATP-binding protein [Saprospiraceae bacterium]
MEPYMESPEEGSKFLIETEKLNAWYGNTPALDNISIKIKENSVVALIGPSGCGKSTLLKMFNRMNDYIEGFSHSGKVLIENKDIYSSEIEVENLRKNVGMVFQKPNPFPKSVYDNVAFGLVIQGITKKSILDEAVEKSLRQAAVWEEVKDNLKKSALALSGGQQQRVCIARALAVEPRIILMDEPASALDPISTNKIEELIYTLKDKYTIVIVTHNMQQAGRVSDKTAFLYMGRLIEYKKTRTLFTNPGEELTERYITGRFG